MSKTEKIIACFGNITQVGIAKMFDVSPARVNQIHARAGLKQEKRNKHRTYEAWRS